MKLYRNVARQLPLILQIYNIQVHDLAFQCHACLQRVFESRASSFFSMCLFPPSPSFYAPISTALFVHSIHFPEPLTFPPPLFVSLFQDTSRAAALQNLRAHFEKNAHVTGAHRAALCASRRPPPLNRPFQTRTSWTFSCSRVALSSRFPFLSGIPPLFVALIQPCRKLSNTSKRARTFSTTSRLICRRNRKCPHLPSLRPMTCFRCCAVDCEHWLQGCAGGRIRVFLPSKQSTPSSNRAK